MIKVRSIGQFNRRLHAEKLSTVQDAGGGEVETWTPVYETFACVEPLSSRRELRQHQTVTGNAYQVQMRFTPSHEVSKDIRFKYEGRILIIDSYEQVTEGRKRFWSLILIEQD